MQNLQPAARRPPAAIHAANVELEKDAIASIGSITFHSRRRTYASLRRACGDDMRYVSAQIGHEDRRFTLKVEATPAGEMMANVLATFAEFERRFDRAANERTRNRAATAPSQVAGSVTRPSGVPPDHRRAHPRTALRGHVVSRRRRRAQSTSDTDSARRSALARPDRRQYRATRKPGRCQVPPIPPSAPSRKRRIGKHRCGLVAAVGLPVDSPGFRWIWALEGRPCLWALNRRPRGGAAGTRGRPGRARRVRGVLLREHA
jgi:hypothetical protein